MTDKEIKSELSAFLNAGATTLCLTLRESSVFGSLDLPGWTLEIQTYAGYRPRQYHWHKERKEIEK